MYPVRVPMISHGMFGFSFWHNYYMARALHLCSRSVSPSSMKTFRKRCPPFIWVSIEFKRTCIATTLTRHSSLFTPIISLMREHISCNRFQFRIICVYLWKPLKKLMYYNTATIEYRSKIVIIFK